MNKCYICIYVRVILTRFDIIPRTSLIMIRVYYIIAVALFLLEIHVTQARLWIRILQAVMLRTLIEKLKRTSLIMIRVYYIIAVALFLLEIHVTQALLESTNDCCGRTRKMNETCANSTHCDPGCLRVLENNTIVCVPCDTLTSEMENITFCNYTAAKDRTSVSTIIKIGGPGVAASVLLGTLLISLFLILSVASFFYLKRSNRLPGVFYRRNKAFIFQPSETAVMIPTDTTSVRKPRYVRRERPSATLADSSATMTTGSATKVYNVTIQ